MSSELTEITLAYWREAVNDCESSGLSVRKWCELHNITRSRYHYWRSKVKEQEGESCETVWAEIVPQTYHQFKNPELIIQCGKFSVEVTNETDISLLTEVIEVLGEIC